jgi:hypothetical protein
MSSIIVDDAHLADRLQGFDAVADIQFFVDVLQMGLDGHRCDIQSGGNFLVAQSPSQQRQNFDFTPGETVMWGCLEIRGLVVACGSEEGGEIFGIIWDE